MIRGTRQSTSTAQTAPRLKTASTHAASTTRCRRSRQREVRPERGPQQVRTAIGTRSTARDGPGQRRGTKNPSVRALRRSPTEERRWRAPPPGQSLALNTATEGGEGEGNPHTSRARPRRAARARGGHPNTVAWEPTELKVPGTGGGHTARAQSAGSRGKKDGDEGPTEWLCAVTVSGR